MTNEPSSPSAYQPHRKLVAVFALAASASVSAYAHWQPKQDRVISDHYLSILEADWHDAADLVVTGDSRSQTSFVPSLLSRALGCRVLNFAQSGRRYSDSYYEAVDRVLDERSRQPAVLMGISAFSLTLSSSPYAPAEEQFEAFDRWSTKHFDRVLSALSPLPKWDVVKLLRPDQRLPRKVTYHHPDGWVVIDRIPRDPKAELSIYRDDFGKHRVDEALVTALLERVRHWSRAGVRVFGTRSPTSRAMLELEDRLSGFDAQEFARQFEQAGGHWLVVPVRDWETRDGGHLTEKAALAYTREVLPILRQARELQRVANQPAPQL